MEIPPAPMTARVGSEFGSTVSEPRLDVTTASRVACESASALRALLRLLGPVWGQALAGVAARKLACLATPEATKERKFDHVRRLKVWPYRYAWDDADAAADGDPAILNPWYAPLSWSGTGASRTLVRYLQCQRSNHPLVLVTMLC